MRKVKGKFKDDNEQRRYRRRLAIRKKVVGTSDVPRLSVTKGNRNLYVQVIDDSLSKTLFSVQTFGKDKAVGVKGVAEKLALKLKEHKLSRIVFDRSGNKYTGVLKSLADSIREQGIRI